MSSWDCGPFDNDTAADFAVEFDEAPKDAQLGMVRAALAAVVNRSGHVDAPQVEVGLAAAAIVARDLKGGEDFHSGHYGPANRLPPMTKDVISLSAEVVDRILNDENDVKLYWSESADADRWFATVRRLRTVLAGDPANTMDPLWLLDEPQSQR